MVATLAAIERRLQQLRSTSGKGRTIYLFEGDPEPTNLTPTDTVVRFEGRIDEYD